MIEAPKRITRTCKDLEEGNIALIDAEDYGKHVVYVFRRTSCDALEMVALTGKVLVWNSLPAFEVLHLYQTGEILTVA